MTKDEALQKLQAVKAYMTSGNPIWDVKEIAEAFDMAIEALSSEPERKRGKWITECERQMIDDVIGSPTWLDIASVRTMKRI